MLKKYEVENIIANALEGLDGLLSKPDVEDGKCTVYESKVTKNDDDLILTFKEDCFSDDAPYKYRIKVEYIG